MATDSAPDAGRTDLPLELIDRASEAAERIAGVAGLLILVRGEEDYVMLPAPTISRVGLLIDHELKDLRRLLEAL